MRASHYVYGGRLSLTFAYGQIVSPNTLSTSTDNISATDAAARPASRELLALSRGELHGSKWQTPWG